MNISTRCLVVALAVMTPTLAAAQKKGTPAVPVAGAASATPPPTAGPALDIAREIQPLKDGVEGLRIAQSEAKALQDAVLATVKSQSAVAAEAKAAAERETKEKEDDVAVLRSGKLIRYGLTGGVAAVVTVGVRELRQTAPRFTGMPYIMFHPRYWWESNRALNSYCASSWVGDGSKEPSDAAAAVAREDAKRRLSGIVAEVRAGSSDEQIVTKLLDDVNPYGGKSERQAARLSLVKQVRSLEAIGAGNAGYKQLESATVQVLANEEWAPHWKGRCTAHRIGVGCSSRFSAHRAAADGLISAT